MQVVIRERQFENNGKIFSHSTLKLCGVQPRDSGAYTCVVESGDTTASLTNQFTVRNYTGMYVTTVGGKSIN